eukprot:3802802-Prymnesium_polylepis.1
MATAAVEGGTHAPVPRTTTHGAPRAAHTPTAPQGTQPPHARSQSLGKLAHPTHALTVTYAALAFAPAAARAVSGRRVPRGWPAAAARTRVPRLPNRRRRSGPPRCAPAPPAASGVRARQSGLTLGAHGCARGGPRARSADRA